MILKEEEKYHKKRRDLQLGNVQLPPSEDADMEQREQFEFDKKSFLTDKRSQEFRNQFRHNDDMFLGENVKIPEIIYLANKSENGYEGDLLSDYYSMFPNAGKDKDKDGILLEPIFISAEHGDGLPDLMQALRKRIPNSQFLQFDELKKKRVQRFHEYKQLLLDEFVEAKEKQLEEEDKSDFDEVEANDLESLIN